jgi:uncharacterized cupin superfamily protein
MVQDLTRFKLDDVKLDEVDMMEANFSIKELFNDDERRVVYEIVESPGGSFEWTIPGESVLFVLKGRQRSENLDTGKSEEINAGDILIYPKDCNARVTILEPVRYLILRWDERGGVPGWPLKEK